MNIAFLFMRLIEIIVKKLGLTKKESEFPKGTIAKKVKVDRTRTSMEAIHATNRTEYLNENVVAEMPSSTEEEMEILFVPFEETLSIDALEEEVDKIGLKLSDSIAVCAVNEQDPTFVTNHPNGTQWRDKEGKACFVIFDYDFSFQPIVAVNQVDADWGNGWFFACVRK